jgi:hypothetical protein
MITHSLLEQLAATEERQEKFTGCFSVPFSTCSLISHKTQQANAQTSVHTHTGTQDGSFGNDMTLAFLPCTS